MLVQVYTLEDFHWVLLAFNLEGQEVGYYAAFEVRGNLKAAPKLVGLVERHFPDMPFMVPDRTNKVLQEPGSLQCGLFVMIYMEQELRLFLGEGQAAAGFPNAGPVQERLKALLQHLEKCGVW